MSDREPSDPEAPQDVEVLVAGPRLEIKKARMGGRTCYIFSGSSASMGGDLRDALGRISADARQAAGDFIVDVSALTYANSTVLGVLIALLGRAGEAGGAVVLVGARRQLLDLLDIMGILAGFRRAKTLAAAAETLSE